MNENLLMWVRCNQCILKTEFYNGLKDLIIKGDTTSTSTLRESVCRYSKLIIVTLYFIYLFFFGFIFCVYKYKQAKILLYYDSGGF